MTVPHLGQHVVNNPSDTSDGSDVGREAHPPLESNGHDCSLAVGASMLGRPALPAVGLDQSCRWRRS
jgi:hypothetical protein